MKKNLLFALFIGISTLAVAQSKKTKKTSADMINRNSDHISIQFGKLTWAGKPDSINTRGFSRTLNVHLIKDFIFKTDNRFSVGIGVGVGSDHFMLNGKTATLNRSVSNTLKFPTQTGTIYTRTKLAATYLEAPVELRFALNPANYDNSFKIALGVKVGQLIDVHTKRKKAETNGSAVTLPTLKEKDKNFFNKTRLAATARVGYGHFSLFGTYQINSFIKDENNFKIKPFTIGICLSGM
jgi:hypothetical protein